MNCNNCNKEIHLKHNVRFCRHCGAKLEKDLIILMAAKNNGLKMVIVIIIGIALCMSYFLVKIYQPKEYKADKLLSEFGNSVVSIHTYDADGAEQASGSGIVVSNDGLILTNNHVIANANNAIVKLQSGAFYPVDKIYSSDSYFDLATIKINASNLNYISDFLIDTPLRVGERVICIGNPLGLNNSLSEGIISALRGNELVELIQTTAPISPGSSGGAMFNSNGKLIGITSLTMTNGQNLNFAIPIRYALSQIYTYQLVDKSNTSLKPNDIYSFIEKERALIETINKDISNSQESLEQKVNYIMNKRGVSRSVAIDKLSSIPEELENAADIISLQKSSEYRSNNFDPIVNKYNSLFVKTNK